MFDACISNNDFVLVCVYQKIGHHNSSGCTIDWKSKGTCWSNVQKLWIEPVASSLDKMTIGIIHLLHGLGTTLSHNQIYCNFKILQYKLVEMVDQYSKHSLISFKKVIISFRILMSRRGKISTQQHLTLNA